jgi:general secretion pathway protein E
VPYLQINEYGYTRQVRLADKPVHIGRSSSNDLAIEEERASRKHCVVMPQANGYVLRDLGSTNGTRVNGKKTRHVLLTPNDEIKIGSTRIRYVDPDAPEAPQASPDAKPKPAAAVPPPAAPPADDQPVDLAGFEDDEAELAPSASSPASSLEDPAVGIQRLFAYGFEPRLQIRQITLRNARGEPLHLADNVEGADMDPRDAQYAVNVFRMLIAAGFKTRASDIHFEPRGETGMIRVRVDGSMVDALAIDIGLFKRILNIVKVLCDMDITQQQLVQEGHFSTVVPGRNVDYRVSFTPAVHGQKLVIRILDSQSAPQHMAELQLPDWMLRDISGVAKQSSGMVLVCGPTGSGKTTTLYAVLRDIDRTTRNVVTIEDPVEYEIDGITHIPCNQQKGNTFHSLLRSVLRQDPDVILLGEIRDRETAQTAMQAAMTGHLVLSTVHAKDTCGTIFRLLDLGVEPYLLSSSLHLVLAQRLIRQLCDNCKAARRPQPTQIGKMGRGAAQVKAVYYPVGCKRCIDTGYAGRRALFELLSVNDAMRDAILNAPTMAAIRDARQRTVFISLAQVGWQLVAQGVCDPDEVQRVVGEG